MIKGVVALALMIGVAGAMQAKSIKDVMAAHKGKESMFSKIADGKGTDEENKKLLGLYEFLATQKPPMGDEASWKEKTSAMVAAAKDVVVPHLASSTSPASTSRTPTSACGSRTGSTTTSRT